MKVLPTAVEVLYIKLVNQFTVSPEVLKVNTRNILNLKTLRVYDLLIN